MELHIGVFRRNGGIPFYRLGKYLLGRPLDPLVCPVNAFLGGHIILIRHIAGKISRLEMHRIRNIVRLNGFHQVIRHFGGAVHRNMLKADAAAPMHHKVAGFGVIVVTVAPCMDLCGPVTHLRIHIGVEKPEGYIDTLDLVDMVLILENLWQQPLSGQMLHQPRLCRLFIQLERDHKIRLEST